MALNNIKVSIIVVTLNNLKGLKKTLSSCQKQQIINNEVIVIDGASTDGTVAYLNSFSELNNSWVSEKDHGIYNAMNKGLSYAKGKWIIFMNAGDVFYQNNTIFNALLLVDNDIDIIFCDVEIDQKYYKYTIKAKKINCLKNGMICSHQSMIFKNSVFKKCRFDERFKYVADYDIFLRCFLSGFKILYRPIIFSKYQAGGLSEKNRFSRDLEVFKSIRSNYARVSLSQYFYTFRALFFSSIVILFGKFKTKFLIDYIIRFFR